ncbi:MAG TPA: ABC transporter substrate-binding protein, partial [Burkholderiaceae bacterium]|nr:ABC transporter substrate-binding protein [Burkholderiaceae bacterium]
IRRAESADQAAVIAALEGAEFDGLTGAESMRAADHQTLKDYYLLKGKAKSAMEDADDYMDVISSGKSFLAPEDTGCTLA